MTVANNLSGINQRDENIPIPTPPEFVEAPQVEAEAPEVETPVEEVKTEEPVKEQEMTEHNENIQAKAPEVFSRRDFNAIRFDGRSNDRVMHSKVKGMSNRALLRLKDLFKPTKGEQISVDAIIDVDGILLKNSNAVGVFEEGGAAYGDGYALTVCGSKGEKLQAAVVYTNDDVLNGLHALVPVKEGDIILLGRRIPKDLILLAAYKIASFETSEDEKPLVRCELQAVFYDNSVNKSDTAKDFDFNYDTPVVKATIARLKEDFATTPCWVSDWAARSFYQRDFFKDFMDSMNDKEFRGNLMQYDSLEEMYQDVSGILRKKVSELGKMQYSLCTTVLDINNKDPQGNEAVYCFVSGVVYDANEKSSKGNRLFYGRVIMHPGDEFFYIDNPEVKIPYKTIADALKSKKSGNHYQFIADTVKRMTI